MSDIKMAKAKKIKTYIKLQIAAGAANPAPPVGPALGQHGVNIMDFCKQFNDKTKTLEKVLDVLLTGGRISRSIRTQ